MRTAYRLAASSFGVVALLALLRVINLSRMPVDHFSMYAQDEFNPVILLLGGAGHMSVALALVLLVTFKLASDLRQQAGLDSLTGLMNRRSFEQESQRLLARAIRGIEPVAVIMIDVDHFKRVNDVYGHQAGDEVLRRLAQLLQSVVRSGDCLARYGGEEFCLMLGDTDEAGAALLAERIRQLYAELQVEWRGQLLQGTLSAGAADLRSADDDVATLIDAADQALYRAKYAGRNRVVLASVSTV
jgi:diguanylate cyclase (GGDEF)-like protein